MRFGQCGGFRIDKTQFHPVRIAHAAVSNGVVGDAVPGGFALEHLDQLSVRFKISPVHQTICVRPDEAPVTVAFAATNLAATPATFTAPGGYEIQCVADDGDLPQPTSCSSPSAPRAAPATAWTTR